MKNQQISIFRIMSICFAILLFGLMNASITHAEKYNFVTTWGSYGNGNGEFYTPCGLAVDSSDNVYVVDANNRRVEKFDNKGSFITTWGSLGSADDQFSMPMGIAIDSSDMVYVVDSRNYRIDKFDTNGRLITSWGTYGSSTGEFSDPIAIATDRHGNVYVTDRGNNCVEKFDSNGKFLAQWDIKGISGMPVSPGGIAVDSQDNVYVAEVHDYRVEKFDSSGNFITSLGSFGTGEGLFQDLEFVAVDSSDSVYVSDSINRDVEKFDSDGNFTAQWGSYGSGNGQFSSPEGIAIDSAGNVYVVDSCHNRIEKFASNANIFYPGINWVAGDSFYHDIAKNLDAKMVNSYKNTDMFSGATQVFLASKDVPTGINFLANTSDYGTYNIAFAHSGGTRTLVKKIESRKVKADYVILAAPALIKQSELEELITNYGVKKVVVFQSDWDMLNLLHVTLESNHIIVTRPTLAQQFTGFFTNLFSNTPAITNAGTPVLMIHLADLPLENMNLITGTIDNWVARNIYHIDGSRQSYVNYIINNPGDAESKMSARFHIPMHVEVINNVPYGIIDINQYLSQAHQDASVVPNPPETFWIGGADRDTPQLFTNWSKNYGGNPDIIVVNVSRNTNEDPMDMHRRLGTTMAQMYSSGQYPFDGSIEGLQSQNTFSSSTENYISI